MSRGPWLAKQSRDTERLIAAVEAKGYVVTSLEFGADGALRVGVQRPGERDEQTVETPETLRKLIS